MVCTSITIKTIQITAVQSVRNILGENNDIWSINVEEDYHEESSTGRAAPEIKE